MELTLASLALNYFPSFFNLQIKNRKVKFSPDCSDILFCDIERSRNMNKKDIAKSGTAFSKNHKSCCSLNYPDFALRSHPFKEGE